MASIQYQMSAGAPGDVNRTHPVDITPEKICAATPPLAYGEGVLIDAASQGVRPLAVADQSATPLQLWGVTVRPFPISQQTTPNAFGAAPFGSVAPPLTGVIDILRRGFIMVSVPAGQAPVKGGIAYIWTAATAAPHVQGGFEAVAPAGNGVPLVGVFFNGAADANGNVEIGFSI